MSFRRGPQINPFQGSSQEPIELLESITATQLASCVPFIKITKIDPRTGRPAEDSRPLMFDLVQTPQFGSLGDDFGVDQETFRERGLVSLNSLKVSNTLSYGLMSFNEVTLQFTVLRPELVFDRSAHIPWHEILEEGMSFSLEYGWSADPTLVPNDLFNGNGHVTPEGVVIKATKIVLLVIARYTLRLKQSGEVEVTVTAYENGDIALRESRFSDAFDEAFGPRILFRTVQASSDAANARRVKALLDGLTPRAQMGRGGLLSVGDVLDAVMAPMIQSASRAFGYSAQPDLLLANFNARAGVQSPGYGSQDLSSRSIGDFLIPSTRLRELLSGHFASGRAMMLKNFIDILVNAVNSADAWAPGSPERQKPEIAMKSDTVRQRDGSLRLVLTIYDRKVVTDVFRDSDRLPLDQQTHARVMELLSNKRVPVLEFARAGSLLLDAQFEMQPDPLLQSIQVESAYKDRKDRVQTTQMPDVESRAGQVRPHEIVPTSILEGDITMYGNFVFETFGLIWIEFFRSSSISGVFHVLEKTDMIEPGRFISSFKVISEGTDPLNTRRRLTDAEIAADAALGQRIRGRK